MTAQHILEDNVCFNYITRVYSTQRDAQTNSVSASRLNKDIQIIHDPAKLRPLLNLRQEAMRAARGSGTKLEVLGCWLVPKENERSLSETFIDIGDRWDRFVADELVPNYMTWVTTHASLNPNEAADIIGLAPSLDKIKQGTRFAYGVVRVKPEDVVGKNLEAEFQTLPEQAVLEIAQDIKDNGVTDSKRFTQATRKILDRIARKAKSLAMLHPRLKEIEVTLLRLLDGLPTAGMIDGIAAIAVRQVLDDLLDGPRFLAHGFTSHGTTIGVQAVLIPSAAEPAASTSAPAAIAREPVFQPDDHHDDAPVHHAAMSAQPKVAAPMSWVW